LNYSRNVAIFEVFTAVEIDGGSTVIRNVGIQPAHYTTLLSRKPRIQ